MSSFRTKHTVLLALLIIISVAFGRMTREEIRHDFLLLTAGDLKYYDLFEKTRKRLYRAGPDAVEIAIEYISRKSPRKQRAIKWIAEGVGEDAVEPLTYVLTRPDEDAAAFAAYLLGNIGSRKGAVPLMLASKSASRKVRSASIGALGYCGDSSAVPILIDALDDSSAAIRRKAAHSLGLLKVERSVSPLIELLSDSIANVRYSASYAIAAIDCEGADSLLLGEMESDSLGELERYHIIETLGLLRSEEARPMLFELLDDPFYLNRGFSCQALGHYRGDYEVANALKRSLNDASGFVQMMAREALETMRNE